MPPKYINKTSYLILPWSFPLGLFPDWDLGSLQASLTLMSGFGFLQGRYSRCTVLLRETTALCEHYYHGGVVSSQCMGGWYKSKKLSSLVPRPGQVFPGEPCIATTQSVQLQLFLGFPNLDYCRPLLKGGRRAIMWAHACVSTCQFCYRALCMDSLPGLVIKSCCFPPHIHHIHQLLLAPPSNRAGELCADDSGEKVPSSCL